MLINLAQTFFLSLLLPFVSDRLNFEDPDHISPFQTHQLVDLSNGQRKEFGMSKLLNEVSGKNILILVHGYNNEYEYALSSYQDYVTYLKPAYDYVIGYLWPGGNQGLEYYSARERVIHDLDLRLLSLLTVLKVVAKNIDIYCHSMGCRLALETLELSPGKLVRNLFLTAPAVDNESLEFGERYHRSTQNCEKVLVFHSIKDTVLRDAYLFGEADRALGYKGPEHPDRLPQNVTVVDCSDCVSSHGDYRNQPAVFDRIKEFIKIPSLTPSGS